MRRYFSTRKEGRSSPFSSLEGQTISYGQLASQVQSFAQALLVQGLRSGDRVALFLENCPDFVVAYLGTHLAGGIVVLVNTQYRQVELSHIMNDAGVHFCVTGSAGQAELSRLDLPGLETLIIVDEKAHEGTQGASTSLSLSDFLQSGDEQGGTHKLTMSSPDAPAVIGYTSGTTGRAKGALMLQRNLLANIASLTEAWQWTSTGSAVGNQPLSLPVQVGLVFCGRHPRVDHGLRLR